MAYAPQADRVAGITETLQAAAVATGNGVAIDLAGCNALSLQVTIATTATVAFEASIDGGVTWRALGLKDFGGGVLGTTATATGSYYMPSDYPPLSHFRARISAWTSGAVDVKSRKSLH